jgi:D-alanyl-D-alanine carboxypeptidase (penicillin-binding protein 5/6)
MNRICKIVIVLISSFVLMLSSSPVLARTSSSHQATAKRHTVKPAVNKIGHNTTFKKKAVVGVNKSTAANKTRAHRPSKSGRVSVSKRALTKKIATRKASGKKSPATVTVVKRSTRRVIARKSQSRPAAQASPVSVAGSANALSRRISARSAMVMDAVTGEAIFAQASDTPAQPASTIKVLTGVISIDALPKNALVPVSRHAAMMPRSKVYLRPGKQYPANDLINAVLLASANDASVALAEKIAGSEQAFAKLMTAKARSFGATNTVCKTANGLTASGQYTTARDLATIFNKAMLNDAFANKMAVTEVVNTDGKVIKSHNRALWQVNGAEGGKTGYTDIARKTYVGKFKRDNDEIIVSLMGSETMWQDVKSLVEYGFAKKRQERSTTASVKLPTPTRLAQFENLRKKLIQTTSL